MLKVERKGFEPSKQSPVYTLSKRAPSATRTPLYEQQEYLARARKIC